MINVSDMTGRMGFGSVEFRNKVWGVVFHPGFEFPEIVFSAVWEFPGNEIFEASIDEFRV